MTFVIALKLGSLNGSVAKLLLKIRAEYVLGNLWILRNSQMTATGIKAVLAEHLNTTDEVYVAEVVA